MRERLVVAAIVAAMALVSGCKKPEEVDYTAALPPGAPALVKVTDPAERPELARDFGDKAGLIAAVDRSLEYFQHASSEKHFPCQGITHERTVHSLETFKQILARHGTVRAAASEVARRFDVYRSVGYDGKGTVLFTGYCQPIYEASLAPNEGFRYPLYKLPPDLVKLPDGKILGRRTEAGIVPYYTRREIEQQGLLAAQGLELVYLRDRLEAFIIHVQGSARLRLRDGRDFYVGYAGKNGRPYTSIGKLLIKDSKIPKRKMSLEAIKRYFAAHPDQLDRYLRQNDSFVFFTNTEPGAFGSLGVKVTPLRSIATDKSIFPRGSLAFVEAEIPSVDAAGKITRVPFQRFVLDQDTGGAIRAAGRTDLYLGGGPRAELLAGHLVSRGKLFYLFLKESGGR